MNYKIFSYILLMFLLIASLLQAKENIALFLHDQIIIWNSPGKSADQVEFAKVGKIYKSRIYDSKWLLIYFDSDSGFVEQDQCYVTSEYFDNDIQLKKSDHYLWIETWDKTDSKIYKSLIDQLSDTLKVQDFQYFGATNHEIYLPLGLKKLLVECERARRNYKYWDLIQIYDEIALKYPYQSYNPKASFPIAVQLKMEQSEIYNKRLHEPDSAYKICIQIAKKYQDYPLDTDEWNNKADIWAFEEFTELTKENKLQDTELLRYYDVFLKNSKSQIMTAIVNLQKSEIYFKNGKYELAEQIFKYIIKSPPLLWRSFKSSGDLRHATIYQWKKLGEEYVDKDYALKALFKIESLTDDHKLLWSVYHLLADYYHSIGDNELEKKYLSKCIASSSNFVIRPSFENSANFSPLPGNWVGPVIGNETVIKSLQDFIKPITIQQKSIIAYIYREVNGERKFTPTGSPLQNGDIIYPIYELKNFKAGYTPVIHQINEHSRRIYFIKTEHLLN